MTIAIRHSEPAHPGVRAFLAGPRKDHLIGGEWVAGAEGAIPTRDPATGKILAEIARGGAAEVDLAVVSARDALERGPWASMTPMERARILWNVADVLEAHIDELAELETLDQGKPLFVGRWAEIPGAIGQFRFFSGQALTIEGRTINSSINYQPPGREVQSWTLREPVGVVAAIVPWNSPLVLTAMKLAPALAAGCTVVLKPSEDTSLTALRLGALLLEAGLPAGVINVVTGYGYEAGAALAAHPGVDKVAFTGSTATGRAILDAAKGNLKRVSLELGGKSPAIVLPDADLELAIPGVAAAIFFNAGQVCVAGSRLYVHRSIHDQVMEGVVAYAKAQVLGHGLDPAVTMGPLVSAKQAEKVAAYVEGAKREGASVLTGGALVGEAGTFVEPAVVTGCAPGAGIARDEVFGPVLVAQAYDDLADVVDAANDSDYGLAASLWTRSLSDAHRLSRKIKSGTVWINCHSMYDASLPIGGVKQSGWGRDSGQAAMDGYLEWKTVCAVL